MTKKQPGQPEKQHRPSGSEQESMGGDISIGKKTGEKKQNRYTEFVQNMRLIAGKNSKTNVEITKDDFEDYIENEEGSAYYRAYMAARPFMDLGDGDEYQRIYVHTYAVKSSFDYKGEEAMDSPDDIGGYFIQIGLESPLIALYVDTAEKKAAKEIHNVVVELAQDYDSPCAIADHVIKKYKEMTSQRSSGMPLLSVQQGTFVPPFSKGRGELLGAVGTKESKELEQRPGRIEYKEYKKAYFYELLERARQKAASMDVLKGEEPIVFPFRGMLTSRRQGEPDEYVDDLICAFPAETFVHSHAIGKARAPLQSEYDVMGYRITVGLDPRLIKSILIHTNESDTAQKIAMELFEYLKPTIVDNEVHVTTPEEALEKLFKNYTGAKSESNPGKPLIQKLNG